MVILVGGLVGTASAFSSAAMEAAASHMYNLGLVKGQVTTGGKVDLALGAEITRAELVTLVVRAFGKEEMAKSLAKAPSFPDVAGHWSAGYVATAMKIVEETGGEPFGLPDGTFNPTGRVTMAQSLAFVMKFLGVGRDQAHSWPEDYIAAGIKAGLITRADAAVIRTAKNDNATRGQVFYMLDNSFSTYKLPDGQSMYEKYVLKSKPVITVDHYPAETHEAFIAITGTAADATAVYVDYGNGQPFKAGTTGKFQVIVKDAAGNPIVNANFHVQMENVLANWSPKNGGELEALFPGTGLVVVTAGSAELRLPVSIVAGPLFALDVTPASGSVALGQEIQFVANGLDEQGFPTDETGLVWSTTLGEISSTGLWKATQAGEGTVTARLGTFEVTVKVVVGQ